MLNKNHNLLNQYNRIPVGIVIGLLLPLLGVFIVYFIGVGQHVFLGHDLVPLNMLLHSLRSFQKLSSFMSVGCVLNLAVFYLLINREYYHAARGIILATIILAIPVIVSLWRTDNF